MEKREFDAWVDTLPEDMQKLARMYPPYKKWRMTHDAPYAITAPGCPVTILSYTERGKVQVRIDPADFSEVSRKRIEELARDHEEEFKYLRETPFSSYVEPQYLVEDLRDAD